MTQVTPPPVRPAADAAEVELQTARPTRGRGGWSIGIFVVMLLLVVAGAIVGFVGSKDDSIATVEPAATVAAATDSTAAAPERTCAQEQQMIAVAFEAYYAENGHSAESFDVLIGSFLREMPTNWTFAPGGVAGTITGIGDCASVGTVDLAGGI